MTGEWAVMRRELKASTKTQSKDKGLPAKMFTLAFCVSRAVMREGGVENIPRLFCQEFEMFLVPGGGGFWISAVDVVGCPRAVG